MLKNQYQEKLNKLETNDYTDYQFGDVAHPDGNPWYTSVLALSLSQGESGLMKIWDGSAWVKKPVKIWDGSTWTQKPAKVWNGSEWLITN